MISILNQYCHNDNGLLLFNPPTGSGKTHAVLQWIFENYKEYTSGNRKIFFVTNLKKNLPFEQLRNDFFDPGGLLADFERDFLFLNSNSELLITNFEKADKEIDGYFTKDDTFRSLRKYIRFINKENDNPQFRELIEVSREEIRFKLEPEFRKKITRYLKDNYSDTKQRLEAIKKDPRFQWIGKIYPSVFTSEKKVFFLSIDKFYAKNSTLVEPSYSFLNNELTKNALVFMDEFDATKEPILSNIIETGKRRKIDFLHLFNEIHWALSQNEFPSKLTEPSKKRKEGLDGKKMLDLTGLTQNLLEKAEDIVKEYRLQYSFKTVSSQKDRKRNLLFHDFQYHSVYRNNTRFIRLLHDSTAGLNTIEFVSDRPDSSEDNIVSLFNRIRGYLLYFQTAIRNIANNYVELKQESLHGSLATEFTFDMALSTVLEEFRMDYRSKEFLTESILSERESNNNYRITNSKRLVYDNSIYENGFRYYDFVDDDQHETITKIYLYNFQNSPEKFILRLAERAMVIGISATALIKTVTGNYDIDYFKKQLGKQFFELSVSEKEILRTDFEQRNRRYKEIEIHTDWLVPDGTDLDHSFRFLLEDEQFSSEVLKELSDKDDANTYRKRRHLKVALAFQRFLRQDDIRGFLCLLNKEPKKNDYALDLNILEKIFNHLICNVVKAKEQFLDINGMYSVKQAYKIVNSLDFDTKKQQFLEKLQKGDKVFVISMYQTMGAGQNLQFIPLEASRLIDLNSDAEITAVFRKTDFNGIYLEKPSHLIQKIDKTLSEEGFIRYLFQLEFLLEAGRISIEQLNFQVTKAFKNLIASTNSKNEEPLNQYLYKDFNIRQHCAKFVIQALGRLCRTNLKARNIYITADADLKELMSGFKSEDTILLHEFEALLKSIETNENKEQHSLQKEYLNKGIVTDQRVLARLKKFIRKERNWTDQEREEWKSLRKLCLTYPTLTSEKAKEHARFLDVYIEIPNQGNKLGYRQDDDGKLTDIFFDGETGRLISEKDIQLDRIWAIPGVKSHFEKEGYATHFSRGKFIICPTMYNSIYKGAIGEEVGRFLLENIGIPLTEMELRHYELFDYQVKDKEDFIDFKFWKSQTEIDGEEQYNKIRRKLDKVAGKRAFIINLFSDHNSEPFVSADGCIIEIPSLVNAEGIIHGPVIKKLIELINYQHNVS